jgi:mRNA interferase MazF
LVRYTPKRGHLIRISFDPQAGHEQMGNRPALVVSHNGFNQKMGLALVCPVSNTKRQNPFYVKIPEEMAVKGVMMTD